MKLYSTQKSSQNGKTPLGNTGSNRQTVPKLDTKFKPPSGFPAGGDVPPSAAVPLGTDAAFSANAITFADGRLCPRIHWLQGTTQILDESLFIDFVQQSLQIVGDDGIFTGGVVGGRGKKYLKSGHSTKNVFYSWNPPQVFPDGTVIPGDGWISISGAVLDTLSLLQLKKLCLLFLIYDFKATRIDFAIDDYSCPSIETFITHAELGNFAGFRHRASGSGEQLREASYQIYCSPYTPENNSTRRAYTLNFGGRGSDKKLRIYDKEAESKGKVKATRFEAQFADEQANVRFQHLCKAYLNEPIEAVQKLIGSLCLGAIDFIDRAVDEVRSRCPRFAWWQELIDALDSLKLPVPRPIPCLERTLDWCARQWACTAAILEKVAGFNDSLDYVTRLFENGRKRLKPSHLSIVNQAIKERFNINSYLQYAS